MDIGKEERTIHIEPAQNPVPERVPQPARRTQPAPDNPIRRKEPAKAPSKTPVKEPGRN